MKRIHKLGILTVIAFLLLLSCSKSDNNTVAPISINGGDIFRLQIVTVILPDVQLTENTYQATLDGVAISLTKSEDTKLVFIVPSIAKIGTMNLVIPAFNNANIKYNVKETSLTETPEVVISGLTTNLNTLSQTLDNSPESLDTKNNIVKFNTIFSNASVADKTTMALFYKANKPLLDSILLIDYNNIRGRVQFETERSLLAKLQASLLCIGVGTLMIDYGEPSIRFLGVLVAGSAVAKSVEYGKLLISLFDYTESLIVDGILGINHRSMLNSSISFQDNVARTVVFNTSNRQLITTDASNTHSEIVTIFKQFKDYNDFAGKVNGGIAYVNTHVFMANFSMLPLLQIPTTSSTTSTIVNAAVFSHVTFSINNPNLTLESVSLQSDGQLNIKVKIIGTPATTPVLGDLNYSYTDAFSSFSGGLPISVDSQAPITGGKLTISTSTQSAGGINSPKNIQAIWIEKNDGTFLKSLIVYANSTGTSLTRSELTNWMANSNGNIIGAITGAARNSYTTVPLVVIWDGTDTGGATVPNDTYRVCMEFSDGVDGFQYFTFTKGAIPNSAITNPFSGFTGISINWAP